MTRSVIFYHGWGCDARVWDPVVAALPKSVKVTRWERGYFGPSMEVDEREFSEPVLVTHSMGLLQVPSTVLASASGLVVLDGFVRFVPEGHEIGVRKALRAMHRQASTDPCLLVRNFREAAGMPDYAVDVSDVHVELLVNDLDRLSEDSADVESLAQVPRLEFIQSRDDRIVHPAAAKELQALFPSARHHFSDRGGHAAPFTQTETVVRRILALL